MTVTLRCLAEEVNGPRFHNRYLLTDIGGLQLGDGVQVGDAGHEDRYSLLDDASHANLGRLHTGFPGGFREVGQPCNVEGKRP